MRCTWGTHYKASMLLDTERGIKTEFDEIVGYVFRKARERKIETPALDFAIRQVRKHVGSTLGVNVERDVTAERPNVDSHLTRVM